MAKWSRWFLCIIVLFQLLGHFKNFIMTTMMVVGIEASFNFLCIRCVVRKFGYLQNKGTSLWHFVWNIGLRKNLPRTVDQYQLSSTDDYYHTSVYLWVQHNGCNTVHHVGLYQWRPVSIMHSLSQHVIVHDMMSEYESSNSTSVTVRPRCKPFIWLMTLQIPS